MVQNHLLTHTSEKKHAKASISFDCNQCGECCSSWHIPIEAHKAKALLKKDWAIARLKQYQETLHPVSVSTYRIPLTAGQVCIFLDENKQCLIQANEGLALKPEECRRFPFATVECNSADGQKQLIYETSAACKYLSEKLLLAFQPIIPARTAGPLADSAKENLSDNLTDNIGLYSNDADQLSIIQLGIFSKCSLEAYNHLMACWQTAYEDPSRSARLILMQLAKALSEARFRYWQKKGPFIGMVVVKLLYHTKNTLQYFLQHLVFFIMPNWRTSLDYILLLFLLRKPYGTLSWVQLLFGLGYADPKLFGYAAQKALTVQVNQIQGIKLSDEGIRLVNAFLFQVVQRKRLLARKSSLKAQLFFAYCALILTEGYARILASLQGEAQVSAQTVSQAIRLTERYYTGHQPRFLKKFQNRWLFFF